MALALILNGCSERGGVGVVSTGVVSDDVFIAGSIKKIETDEALRQETYAPYDSLTEASAIAAQQDVTQEMTPPLILQALAVQGSEIINYTGSGELGWTQDGETIINVATITFPAVSLTFDGGGNISAVTAYFADASYDIALDANDSATYISSNIANGAQSDATIAKLTADREQSFGFASNYMVYIDWNLERRQGDANRLATLGANKDRTYSINGNMIAGVETDNVNIPSNGEVAFIGKGRGYYSHVSADNESHTTIFDVTTDVDFFAQSINVNSANTKLCSNKNQISSCTTAISSLDFSTQETFIYIINNKVGFRGDVSLKADRLFTGTIDARFYGGRAQELGSIFAMRDETGGYYYGAFGGERAGVEAPIIFNAIIGDETLAVADAIMIDEAIDVNNSAYDSLTAVVTGADGNAFMMRGLAIYKNDTTDYTRAPNRDWDRADTAQMIGLTRLAGSASSLTFDSKSGIGVTLFLGDATYINDNATITIDRSNEFFGFDSNYMAHIGWNAKREYRNFDNENDGLADSIYNISGVMLAGIETADANIPAFGEVSFGGSGSGTYGRLEDDVVTSYNTVFDILVEVDFGAGTVTLNSSNTCKGSAVSYCGNDDTAFLDFSISSSSILYNSNNINGAVNADSLTGTFDARFYGADAWELGGTFALANHSDYYYGVFGALRGRITASSEFDAAINDENAVMLPNNVTISTNYASLTDAVVGDILTLNSLSVYQNDTTIYTRDTANRAWSQYADKAQTINIRKLTGAVASLYFDDSDNIEVTLYTNGIYTNDNDNATIKVDKIETFGFNSNYMAYISWNLAKKEDALDNDIADLIDNTHNYMGAMLAGVETADATIPSTENPEFEGKGRGTYGGATENYATIFDVIATVDFDAKNLTIRSRNTCLSTKPDCTGNDDEWRSNLNFTTDLLSFANRSDINVAVNNINGFVETDNSSNSLTGTVDARFYGADAREFGGTFALTNSSDYYYGAFGAQRDGIVKPLIFDARLGYDPVTDDNNLLIDMAISNNASHASLAAVVNAADGNAFTMRGLSIYQKDTTIHTRAPNREWDTADKATRISIVRLVGAAASLTFDGSNTIGVTLYTNDTAINDSATVTVDRSDIFGFDANYMAYIGWEIDNEFDDNNSGLKNNVFDVSGKMLAGIETISITANSSGRVDFSGKGRGTYSNFTTKSNVTTIFDVTASVDFTDKNVTINIFNSCKASDCENQRENYLNFNTVPLSFVDNKNSVVNNISARNLNVNGIEGTLDARFYGGATEEFGGTFAFANDFSYYYGVFGAERGGTVAPIMLNAENNASVSGDNVLAINTAISTNNTSFKTLTAVAAANGSNSFTISSLSAYQDDSTTYTRASQSKSWSKADKAQEINITRLNGSAASIEFNDSGTISGVTVYLKDSIYTANLINGTPTATMFSASISGADNDASTATINVNRGVEFFGFASNNMAYIDWYVNNLESDLDNDSFDIVDNVFDNVGIMMTGIETVGDNILTFGTSVKFMGKGRGIYGNVANNTRAGYHTVFDVTASVNFADSHVTISSENTCQVDAEINQNCIETQSALDFSTGLISYTGNNINGAVALTDNNQFTGTLDARFYGYVGHEFGGTFSLSNSDGNADSYYYGAFGANRETFINFTFDTQNIADPIPATIPTNVAVSDPIDGDGNAYISIYSAVQDKNGQNRIFTMNMLAVSAIDKTSYFRVPHQAWDSADRNRNVTLTRVENSLASLTINGSGQLSDISIYINDVSYTATANLLGVTTLDGNLIATSSDGHINDPFDAQTISLSRDESLFGFRATDMVYISWELSNHSYLLTTEATGNGEKQHGIMIAGIETDFANIPTIDSVDFTGKGRGTYSNITDDSSFTTIFDVTASVDFLIDKVTIQSHNTCQKVDCNNNKEAGLDFTTTNAITYYTNDMSGDAYADGIGVNNSLASHSLAGKLDARFYGDSAHKLGGTFVLSNADSYYYGAFGTQRLDAITQFKFNRLLLDEDRLLGPASTINFLITSQTAHTSLHQVAVADGSNSFTMNALTVYQSNQTDYARVPNKNWNDSDTDTNQNTYIGRLSNSGASITFDDNGNISGVATYLANSSYIAANSYTVTVDLPISGTDIVKQNISDADTPDDATIGVMTLHRGTSFFGFDSSYMVYVDWRVTKTDNDLGSGTVDDIYDYSGSMLAGIETVSISNSGIFEFTGKGRGNYGNSKNGYIGQTSFDVTATVNFTANNVVIKSSGTVKCSDAENMSDCSSDSNIGEFSTGTISYRKNNVISNNISGDVTATIVSNNLTGTLDARFYGGVGYELGGTFALTGTGAGGDYYYYGAFGTQRIYTSFAKITTNHAETPIDTETETKINKHGLTGFNDPDRVNKAGNALPATMVQITQYNDKKIESKRIEGAVVEFNYRNVGAFEYGDSLKLYFADKKYTSLVAIGDVNYIQSETPNVDGGDRPYKFNLVKYSSVANGFDFIPNYMALVFWDFEYTGNSKPYDYESYGYAITGFETVGGNIPTSNTSIFTGVGRGRYYNAIVNDETYFDIVADVNFGNQTIELSSINTCTSLVDNDCEQANYNRSHLNWAGTLSYMPNINKMSGAIVSSGDVANNIKKLDGIADARFYGTLADSATEFGGTFSLYNNQSAYVGHFSAKQAITNITTTVTLPLVSFNQHNLNNFEDANRTSKINNTLKATTVQITRQKSGNQAITIVPITGAVAEFDYDSDNDFADTGFSFYFADKKYSVTAGTGIDNMITASIIDAGAYDTPDDFELSLLGNHMALIEWKLDETLYESHGYAITGFETVVGKIFTHNNANFIGQGVGQYYYNNLSHKIYYGVTADVDFSKRTVSVTSEDSCISDVATDCEETINQRSYLNFTGELSYQTAENIIKGVVTTISDSDDGAKLFGTAEARFYGANVDAFGGTFIMQNDDAGYIGYFGTTRDYVVAFDKPTLFNANNITNFNDVNRGDTNNNALQATTVEITKQKTGNEAITTASITDSVAEFNYNSTSSFSNLNFYYADKKYSIINASVKTPFFLIGVATGINASTPDRPQLLSLTRTADFDFTANHMALVYWTLQKDSYDSYGYAITGFETDTIPMVGTDVTFTGRGSGYYYDADSDDELFSDVTADVDFTTRIVGLKSENTCSDDDATNCEETSYQQYHLNFTGDLSYEAGVNKITGNIETTGNATNTKLTGTADARFYGPAAEELGGTFNVSNANAGYVGYFGVKQ